VTGRPRRLAPILAAALVLAACGSAAEEAADTRPESGSALTGDDTTADSSAGDDTTGDSATTGGAIGDGTETTSGTTAPTATTVDPAVELANRLGTTPLPATAEALAAELTETETALGDPTLTSDGAQAWGRRQQLLYRVLSAHPDWAERVLAGVDPLVRDVVALNWEARSNLAALVRSESIAATLPAWEIVAPAPADDLIAYYREAADATGVPWEVLAAINLVETRMGRIRGVSTAGAIGPMQFLPTTWEGCCTGDPTKDRDAILGAAQYLVDRGAPGDVGRAIFGYNNSERYVTAVQAYAEVLSLAPQRYYGYHAWEVVFLSSEGLVRLPEGYRQAEPVDAAAWLADNPGDLISGAT
jgi:hypothetical protein